MFCLGCGTEVPSRAVTCAVCGRQVGRAASEIEWSATAPALAPSLPSAGGLRASAAAAPAIRPGELDAPSLPRDTQGRALLITAVALAADLLAPWRVVFGQHESLAQAGLPALAVLALIAAAMVPLTKPAYRADPRVAVLPLAVGCVFMGLGVTYWGFIPQLNARAVVAVPEGLTSTPGVVVGPDIGLYLFLLGAGVLVLIGYQLFLAAATARAEIGAGAPVAAVAESARSIATTIATTDVHMATPVRLEVVASGMGAGGLADLMNAQGEKPLPIGEAVATVGSNGHGHAPAPTSPAGVPLPGSKEWTQAPALPPPLRPSSLRSGWNRRGPRGGGR